MYKKPLFALALFLVVLNGIADVSPGAETPPPPPVAYSAPPAPPAPPTVQPAPSLEMAWFGLSLRETVRRLEQQRPAAAPPPPPAPPEEQFLRRANDEEPASLDPQLAQGSAELHILRDLFVGLVDEDADGRLIGGLASGWSISDDGLTYIFKLRPSRWSDGTPVRASDVVFGWQRAVNPDVGSKYSFFLEPVKNASAIISGQIKELDQLGIRALDDQTLQVQLEHPTPYFLGMLVNAVSYPVPRHVVNRYGNDWPKYMVSNGPFKLDSWTPGVEIKLLKSEYYYDRDRVRLQGVSYYPINDKQRQLELYQADQLDLTSDVPHQQLRWIRANLGDQLKIHNFLGTYYFGFNLKRAPFKNNVKLREALSLAVDRELLTRQVSQAGEHSAYGFVVPGVANYEPYTPDYARWSQHQRNQAALQAYAEAGYSREHPVQFELLYNNNDNNKRLAIAVAAMWKRLLGVQVTLVGKDWKDYLLERRNYNTQMFRSAWVSDYDDANSFLSIFSSSGNENVLGYEDPDYNRLLQTANASRDSKQRAALLQAAERRLLENHSLIPLYFFVSRHLIKPRVQGYRPNVNNRIPSKYLWLSARPL